MALEVKTRADYEKIERLGLLPTDRDPSAWLRMVARVMAAYKNVNIEKSVTAYIDGFWILNKDNLDDNDHWKFVIQKGVSFIDDQLVGFTDDIIFKYPKQKLISGNTYWLVLKYKWAYEFDYNLGEFDVIYPNTFVEGEMLKVAAFKINLDNSITLLPQDLDDQYASNFKKLFEIASKKIIDTLETIKYHYEVYSAEDKKIDPSCKSGDFVYLDYLTNKYKPARACTKKFDKAVGVYLYNQSNNKYYIIYNGVVDFSDPRWKIDKSRLVLLTLEPGESYFLRDGCTKDDTEYDKKTLGMITTEFYPSTVRVGYAITRTKMFVQVDFASDLNMQNILELFGDNERFTQKFQDSYKYYSLIAEIQFLVNSKASYQTILKNIEANINNLNHDKTASNSRLSTAKSKFDNQVTDFKNTITSYNNNLNKNLSVIDGQLLSQISKKLTPLQQTQYYNSFDAKNQTVENILTDKIKKLNDFENLAKKEKDDDLAAATENVKNDLINIKNISAVLKSVFENNKVNIKYKGSNELNLTIYSLNQLMKNLISKGSKYKSDYQSNIKAIEKLLNTLITDLNNYKTNFKNDFKNFYNEVNKKHIYKDTDIILNLSEIKFNKTNYTIGINTTQCLSKFPPDKDSDEYYVYINEDNIPARTYTGTTDETDSNYAGTNKSFITTALILYSQLNDIYKTINNLSQINNYFYHLCEYYLNIGESLISEYIGVNNLNNNKNSIYNELQDLYNTKSNYEKEKINNDNILYYENHLNKYYLNMDNLLTKNVKDSSVVSEEITKLQGILGEMIDEEKPVKSIFTISNYQRIIYNYSYITQRLKIKYTERKRVEDDIEIIKKKLIDLYSQPIPNTKLIHELENLKGSFLALKEELNKEIETLTQEYNRIRTTFLGLKPILSDDPHFDPGKYAISNLDCLETSE